MPDRRQPFILSATSDFPDDITRGPYSLELLDELMRLLKSMGVSRVNWQYYGDVERGSHWAMDLYADEHHHQYGLETLERIGEPLKAAVPAAHRHGLEIYGVLKPYDTGYSSTFPEGSPEAAKAPEVARVGGRNRWTIPFIQRFPHMRIRRRPAELPTGHESTTVKKIRLLKKDDSPTRVRKENLQIWTSPVNYRYERRDVEFTLTEAVEPSPREVRDFDGNLVTARGAPVRTLTLKGLDLAERYILVTTNFKDAEGDFQNTPLGMVEAYGSGREPLTVEVGTRMAKWGPAPRDFRTYGLEFDLGLGNHMADLDVDNTAADERERGRALAGHGVIAIAKGRNEYIPGVLCEAEPEVRKLWGGWIDRMIDAGVDGVDVRLNSHGMATNRPYEYGFNEVLVEEYQSRFAADLLAEDADLQRLARLRGEHFTDFIRESGEKVRRAGKKMQAHVHIPAYPLRPDPDFGQIMWMPANIEFDWRGWIRGGLIDEVTLRGGPEGHPEVEEMLAVAKEMGVPVHRLQYIGGAPDSDAYAADIERVFNDERFSGFIIYEIAGIALPTQDGSRLVTVKDRSDRIRAKAKELGVL
jgi:hypothetical protein